MTIDIYSLRRLYHKVQDRCLGPRRAKPRTDRVFGAPPQGSASVTVEVAINSRCTSDHDGDQCRYHWGRFSQSQALNPEFVAEIAAGVAVPLFTSCSPVLQAGGNLIDFLADASPQGNERQWHMVESGMQQQAVGLECATRGLGMVLLHQGDDGRPEPGGRLKTMRIVVDLMEPAYDGAFWTDQPPRKARPWLDGNLPAPDRRGSVPFSQARKVVARDAEGRTATIEHVGQLLWAARGRTPHFVMSEPWGLTIPTCKGMQGISSVSVVSAGRVYSYVNWQRGRPTHSIRPAQQDESAAARAFLESSRSWETAIVFATGENLARGSWEIGYSLYNTLLQSQALRLCHKAVLLDQEQVRTMHDAGLPGAQAAVLLKGAFPGVG